MNASPMDSSTSGSLAAPSMSNSVFQIDASSVKSKRWGELFAVFASDLDAAIDRMQEVVDLGELEEDVKAASRRYGAFIEGMCLNMSKASGPCISYELAPGFSVLLIQHVPADDATLKAVEATFEENTLSDEAEPAFVRFLSAAMHDFFSKNVQPGHMLRVELSGCDYVFTRSADRDSVLRDINLGTSALQF